MSVVHIDRDETHERERVRVCVASAINPLANLTFFNEKKNDRPTDGCVCVGV